MFDFRVHLITLAPMESQAFGLRLRANRTERQNRFLIRRASPLRTSLARNWSAVFLYCIAALFWLPRAATADETWLPPSKPPVEVTVGFFLANLSGAAERSETFEADLYLTFRWYDPRLAFDGTEPKRFLEEAAVDQLQKMWWPQLEFVNTGAPDVANRALDIAPDGSVSYKLAVTATFRSDLDLRRLLRVRRVDRSGTAADLLHVDGVCAGNVDFPDLVHDLRRRHREFPRPNRDRPDSAAGVHRHAVHGELQPAAGLIPHGDRLDVPGHLCLHHPGGS